MTKIFSGMLTRIRKFAYAPQTRKKQNEIIGIKYKNRWYNFTWNNMRSKTDKQLIVIYKTHSYFQQLYIKHFFKKWLQFLICP